MIFMRRPIPPAPRPACERPGCARPASWAVRYPRGAVRKLCTDCTETSMSAARGDGIELDVVPVGVKR